MANTSPTTIYGAWVDNHRLYSVVTWPTVSLGATSVVLTINTYFQSNYSVTDSSNAFSITVSGGTVTKGSTNISHGSSGGTTLVHTRVVTLSISQTAVTNIPISATLSGVEAIDPGSAVSLSSTLVIAASGVPYSHPTITAKSYDFSVVATRVTNAFSFDVSGGQSWSLKSTDPIRIVALTSRDGSTEQASTAFVVDDQYVTANGSTRFVSITTAQRDTMLDYWNQTAKQITKVKIEITTVAGGAEKKHTIYVLPPSLAELYSIASFTSARGAVSGGSTTTQSLSCTIKTLATSPFRQAEIGGSTRIWPSTALSMAFFWKSGANWVNTSLGSVTGPTATSDPLSKTYTLTDNNSLLLTASREYKAQLKQDASVIYTAYSTLMIPDNFVTLKKGATLADHRVGIGTGSPDSTLHVKGTGHVTGILTVDGDTHVTTISSDATWHLVGGASEPAFASGWSNVVAGREARFYKDPMGFVHIGGQVKHSTNGAGTTVFTLPTGYRPTTYTPVFPTACNGGSTGFSAINVDPSTGNVKMENLGTGATGWLLLDGMTFYAG